MLTLALVLGKVANFLAIFVPFASFYKGCIISRMPAEEKWANDGKSWEKETLLGSCFD